ncbi:transcriptional regulator [Salipaludibacillus keqinensis]|uniref:Transcriptional regulator n=1 Tax=Salipaludibacillus keqinensis TaxID=2045207 RepID=A0A323TBW1_9BACI|nr:helix-turn-helix transcriptional regulator [Salipaludibacillus keqinensis]PYZ92678.1 transcriptional regulator [Salipaludibacillus keqinensis]
MDLKKARKEAGMTQKQLGEHAGMSKNYIYRVENNKRPLSHSLRVRLTHAIEKFKKSNLVK